MSAKPGIPRNSLIWLLVAQVLVILPHLTHLPLWIIGPGLRGLANPDLPHARSLPAQLDQGAADDRGGIRVYFSRGSLVGLEAGVVLLIAAFILKLVEMSTRRDSLVLIFLGFFAVVTSYLFEDSLLAGLYSLLPVTALLAAMIGLQQSSLVTRPWPTVLAGALLLQAVPLMLVLFLFFPRLPPLWSLPQAGDRVRPVWPTTWRLAISRGWGARRSWRFVSASTAIPRDQLYWRAVTFERFDGRRWSQSYASNVPQAPEWQALGEPLSYSVVMQPSGQPWLFALDVAQVASGGAQLMTDFHLQRRQPVTKPLMYRVTSWLDARREAIGAPESLARALQMPEQGNPRSRTWLPSCGAAHRSHRQWWMHCYGISTASRITTRWNHRRWVAISSTTSCSRPAAALCPLRRRHDLRAARGGYSGARCGRLPGRRGQSCGQLPFEYQFDAHAWVEYWVAERGWVSVDPTFQVAPERVEQGLEQALARERSFRRRAAVAAAVPRRRLDEHVAAALGQPQLWLAALGPQLSG